MIEIQKEIVLRVHWPDHVEYGQGEASLNTKENLKEAVDYWQESLGIHRFYWRVDHWFIQRYCLQRRKDREVARGWSEFWEKLSKSPVRSLADFVQITQERGAKAYLYLPFLDEGLPHDLVYLPRGTPYPYQSRFSRRHPEFLEVDRTGNRRHWGVLCYAHPEVQSYRLQILQDLLAEVPADGLHLCTRSYVSPAPFGDQFGFNPPIVSEYLRRHGVDILQSDFNLESWRQLRGEFLSSFLFQVKALLTPENQSLSLAIPRGNYFGPPYGNLHLDWRGWVREGIVDELVVNVISGRQLTKNLPIDGYLCDTESGLGMNTLEEDLRDVYAPICGQAGCKLYLGAGVDLNRHSPVKGQLEELARLPSFEGFVFTTGNLGRRFSFDKRGRPVFWRIEDLDLACCQ